MVDVVVYTFPLADMAIVLLKDILSVHHNKLTDDIKLQLSVIFADTPTSSETPTPEGV